MAINPDPLPTDTRVVRLRRWLAKINQNGAATKNRVNPVNTQRQTLAKILGAMQGK